MDLARAWSWACLRGTTHAWRHLAASHARRHSTSHATSEVRVASHDHIHESHWILLDSLVDLRIVLLQTCHELLIKLRILAHALGHVCKLRILHECHQLGAGGHACASATLATGLAHACVLVAVVRVAWVSAGWDLVEVDALEQEGAGEVCVTACQSESLDALLSGFVSDRK